MLCEKMCVCSVITKIQANDSKKLLLFSGVYQNFLVEELSMSGEKKENFSHKPSKDQGHSHTMIACWLVVTKQHSPFGKFA